MNYARKRSNDSKISRPLKTVYVVMTSSPDVSSPDVVGGPRSVCDSKSTARAYVQSHSLQGISKIIPVKYYGER